MKKTLWILGILGSLLHAETTLNQAIETVRADIIGETQLRVSERTRIAAERRELHIRLAEQESRLVTLRAEADRVRRVQRQHFDQARLQREALGSARQREADLRALAREARRSLETLLPSAIAGELRESFEHIDSALRGTAPLDASTAARLTLETHLRALQVLSGIHRPAMIAIAPDGKELQGQGLIAGPLAWFRSDDGLHSGVLVEREGSAAPRCFPVDEAPAIAAVFDGKRADIPMDFSGGRALTLASGKRPWTDQLRDGGLTMIPLGLTALAAIVIVLLKTLSLLRVKGSDPRLLTSLAAAQRSGDRAAAAALVAEAAEPLRSLLEGALAHPGADAEQLEELLHERMLGLIPQLDRHLGTLAVLGGVAPLLGLLGTVTGMIHTFELVTLFGSGNERILSQGISEALITTMAGLIIAVPVLLAHAFLSRRVRVIIGELEQSIAAFILARHGGGEPA